MRAAHGREKRHLFLLRRDVRSLQDANMLIKSLNPALKTLMHGSYIIMISFSLVQIIKGLRDLTAMRNSLRIRVLR